MKEITKAIAAIFSTFYGETLSPEQAAAKMFAAADTQTRAASWLIGNTTFKAAQYITPQLCRDVQAAASRAYVGAALNGHARKIVCLSYPCALVWCESTESSVNDPWGNDLPEYARINKQTGAITWERHADLLNNEQRRQIIMSVTAYNPDAVLI